MTTQEINAELIKVNAQIDRLNFDENGNAIDREYADKLFTHLERLEEELLGKSLTIVTI